MIIDAENSAKLLCFVSSKFDAISTSIEQFQDRETTRFNADARMKKF